MLSFLLAFIFVVVNMAAHLPARADGHELSGHVFAGAGLACLAETPASPALRDGQPAGKPLPDSEINHCFFHFIFVEPVATGHVSLAVSTRLILSGESPKSLYPDIGKKPPRPSV